jgi:two-component system LytT family sensor kinase
MLRLRNHWLIHLSAWLLFAFLPLTIISHELDPGVMSSICTSLPFWIFISIYLAVYYGNTFLLIPRLFFTKRYVAYFSTFAICFFLFFYTKPFENLLFRQITDNYTQERDSPGAPAHEPPGSGKPAYQMKAREPYLHNKPPHIAPPQRMDRANQPAIDFVSLVLFLVVWAIAMAVKISEQWRWSEKRMMVSETEKAKAELSFLKAQINPHFLFNTLNNIYSLAVVKSDHTADGILKLSQLLRYITEEASADFVPLVHEIQCLENYIDLQRLRLNTKTTVNFDMEGSAENQLIAPLILITFIENAFKYGVSNRYENLIEIKIRASGHSIEFSCRNKITETTAETDREGVGILNTEKRLKYLYADRYDLEIRKENGLFEVDLKLQSMELK